VPPQSQSQAPLMSNRTCCKSLGIVSVYVPASLFVHRLGPS
jgi:hypothetical protein